MRRIAILLVFTASAYSSFCQSAVLKGFITDTVEKKILSNSVVLVLRKADSVMVKFARSDHEGNFAISGLPAGKFLIMVSYPKYADFVDEIELRDSQTTDISGIMMTLKSHLLKEVVIRAVKGAVRLHGDTTEYKADSFKVAPNATVEDLLKKLPGIQVDKNGKITTQGETVQKVLVDGEEFFGDDPTLVTKNLRADMVDKVQVFDKKSDQAAFTGIDDGQKTKTVNIKLKEEKKNGYFGKASAGIGTDGYHDSQLLFNKFKKKEKFSFYGIVSNAGTAGLSWQDQNNFGGGNGFLSVDDNGDVVGQDDISGWNGNFSGEGYPLVQTGGLHYNNKWDNDKQSGNANYKAIQLFVNGNTTTNSEYILPDSSYYQNQTQRFNNRIIRNKLSGTYELDIDSASSLKFTQKLFLIKDSVRKIDWKITNETRKIAGFDCRRANAVILDSIYVVAFFTEEIITPGGPESFAGLPGMIMGVALPHEHMTWFATKLMAVPVKDTDLAEPIKGKVSTNAALKENLKQSLKDWGKYGEKYVKQVLL